MAASHSNTVILECDNCGATKFEAREGFQVCIACATVCEVAIDQEVEEPENEAKAFFGRRIRIKKTQKDEKEDHVWPSLVDCLEGFQSILAKQVFSHLHI